MLSRDEIRLLELRAKGKTLRECASILGRTYDSTRWMWRTVKHRPGEVLEAAAEDQVSVLPVKPIVVEPQIPAVAAADREPGALTAVHYGDLHIPFEDDAAVDLLYQVLEAVQPELIVCHGDLLDCYSISDYEKDPEHRIGLQQELERGAEHLATVAQLAPDSERLLIGGNHEDRLRRTLWKAATRGPLKEILYVPAVKSALTWEKLLGLDSSGWRWVEQREILFGKLVLKHGSVVRKHSGYSARAEMEKYSKSGISGHTHRVGAVFERDWNGYHGWWEHGCLCGLQPGYTEHPNWQQGFVVVTWSADRETFSVEQLTINEGKVMFRGEMYEAR